MSASIESLQRQIAALQGLNAPQLSLADIQKVVKDTIAEELGSKPVEQPKAKTILEAIGCSLTEEEQMWFSDIKNLAGLATFLPGFLVTEPAVNFIKELSKAYRAKHEN